MVGARVTVLGGGVIGLSTALALLERDPSLQVTVVAEHLPDSPDAPASYASVWAGAHHVSDAKTDRELRHDQVTFDRMRSIMSASNGAIVPVEQKEVFAFHPKQDPVALKWYPGYKTATPPPGFPFACTFETVNINVPRYLSWLVEQLRARGAVLRATGRVESLADVAGSEVDLLVVAVGLGARNLVGDDNMHPVRGQVVLVKADVKPVSIVGRRGRETYTIPRGDGTTVCGGTRLPNDSDPAPRQDTTHAILERCAQAAEGIKNAPVLAVNVGLRPARTGGARLERGQDVGTTKVVYSYGYGGFGYQASWGAALDACDLVLSALRDNRARL